MFVEQKKMVPPDGGWGWVAVIGVSIVNFCTRSIEPSFGLLFGDLLKELGVGTAGGAVIMSMLDALINFSGLFVGPLIRAFSYRKVSIAGAILCTLGLVLTSPATSMTHIIATYSIINGLGVGLAASSTFVALNHYFIKKRGQAVGFSLAGTAFGMMVIPHAVKFLLDQYGFRGATLVIGAVALHGLAGSCLLQPAKWHFIPEEPSKEEEGTYHQEMETIKETDDEENDSHEGPTQTLIKNNTVKTLEELEKQTANLSNLPRKATFPRNFSTMSFVTPRKRKDSKESIMSSYSRLDFTGSSLQMHLTQTDIDRHSTYTEGLTMRRNMSYPGVQLHSNHKLRDIQRDPIEIKPKKQESFWRKVVTFMDLDLLKDPIYLNLVFGLSIFYVAEQNFKMVTPFFFEDINYDKGDVALFLSVQALTDILARLVLPPICDRITITKRTLFMSGIFLLAIFRSVLAEQTEYTNILLWLVVCGFFRGAALINFTICISEYSSLEKLPAAFGLHMVGKGLFVVIFGPILGIIRDATGSFPICLHSQSFLIMLCVLAWGIEYIIVWMKNRNKGSETSSDVTTAT